MTSSPTSADGLDLTLEERLAAVKAAGGRRRSRRLRLRSTVAGVAAVAIVAGLAMWPGDEATVHTDVASDATSTTRPTEVLGTVIERDAAEATTSTVVTEPTPPEPTTSVPTSGSVTPPVPTTAAPVVTAPPAPCQSGPECGPFRWEPAPPPDQPLHLTHDPVGPAVVGEEVTITVRWSDGDARLTWIDDDSDGSLIAETCTKAARYGPWPLPSPSGGQGAHTIRFTPSAAGTATVEVYAATGTCDGYDAYHSASGLIITFEVAPGGPPQP